MMTNSLKVLLADDDLDDCVLFKTALNELPVSTNLTTVYDGEDLLKELHLENAGLPDLIFLDLNMPRKNGTDCLDAIKSTDLLKEIPVVIFSTSVNNDLIKKLVEKGARDCVRKPSTYPELKKIILHALQQLQ